MAYARKCDRCGTLYDPLSFKNEMMVQFRNPVFVKADDIRECRIRGRLLENEPADALVDLCPKCSEDFELFMDNYPLAIRAEETCPLMGGVKDGLS